MAWSERAVLVTSHMLTIYSLPPVQGAHVPHLRDESVAARNRQHESAAA